MKKSQQIELFCTNGFSRPHGIERNLVSISCAHGSKFHMNGRLYNFDEFTCRKYPIHSVYHRPLERCFNGGLLFDVGFQVEKQIIRVLTVCHDTSIEQTYFVKYRLTPANVAAQQGFSRPSFIQGEFFPGKDINFLYTRNQQRETISETVQSDVWAHKLVRAKGELYLSRGKLSPL